MAQSHRTCATGPGRHDPKRWHSCPPTASLSTALGISQQEAVAPPTATLTSSHTESSRAGDERRCETKSGSPVDTVQHRVSSPPFRGGHRDELERMGSERWCAARSAAGRSGSTSSRSRRRLDPEHGETQRDQGELFFVISGSPILVIDGETIRPAGGHSRESTHSTSVRFGTTARSRHRC